MRRRLLSGAGANPPANTLASDGHPSPGDHANGVAASVMGAFWFYLVQEAIVTVIEQAGLQPSDVPTQFRDAVVAVAAAASPALTFASLAEARGGAVDDKPVAPDVLQDYLNERIAALIGGAPGALDTLNELAEALNDDADFHTSVTNALALKAALASPIFTGTPKAPTPPAGDDSTRLATTAWVHKNAGGIGNLAFFSRTEDLVLSTQGWTDVAGGNVGPVAAEDIIGLVFNADLYSPGVGTVPLVRVTRGGSAISESLGSLATTRFWLRNMLLDKPGAAQQVDYRLEAARNHQSDRIGAGSSLTVLKMPPQARASILTDRLALLDDGDILSVTITPPTATSKIQLRVYLPYASGAESGAHRLLRDNQALVSGHLLGGQANTLRSDSFMDWIDEPATDQPVTYKLDFVESGNQNHQIGKGAYLLALPLAA